MVQKNIVCGGGTSTSLYIKENSLSKIWFVFCQHHHMLVISLNDAKLHYYYQPKEGKSIGNFFYAAKLPKDIFIIYEGGFAYINPRLFPEWFAPELIASPDFFS